MSRYARRFTRRTLLLSLLTLAAFKKLAGMRTSSDGNVDETIMAGRWLLKKSDLA